MVVVLVVVAVMTGVAVVEGGVSLTSAAVHRMLLENNHLESELDDEHAMSDVASFLTSGRIAALHTTQEVDEIVGEIRPEVKAAGLVDSREQCWAYFLAKVRANLHVLILVSPLGRRQRERARRFPAIHLHTYVDWFGSWPEAALIAVAHRFLGDEPDDNSATAEPSPLLPTRADPNMDEGEEEEAMLRDNLSHHMAFVHTSVAAAATALHSVTGRRVYATPKAYLELLSTYRRLLAARTAEHGARHATLSKGLLKLRAAAKVRKAALGLTNPVILVQQQNPRF